MNNEFDDIFSNTNTEEPVEVLSFEEPPKNEEKIEKVKEKKKFSLDLKNDKVLMIQILLFGIWAILTIIIYFFGYPLFEAFIDV
ncbi:MAG: hypothetical protein IKF37_02265 [Bacilli bacterium]|nr:hypothetical protein [Bacilli bacterium]